MAWLYAERISTAPWSDSSSIIRYLVRYWLRGISGSATHPDDWGGP